MANIYSNSPHPYIYNGVSQNSAPSISPLGWPNVFKLLILAAGLTLLFLLRSFYRSHPTHLYNNYPLDIKHLLPFNHCSGRPGAETTHIEPKQRPRPSYPKTTDSSPTDFLVEGLNGREDRITKQGTAEIKTNLSACWNHVLATIHNTDWEVQEVDKNNRSEDFYSLQMFEGFKLEHEDKSHFIWQHSTDTLVALTKDGSVYGFAIDFDWGYLISDTIDGAMSYISNPGTRAKGPARRPWGPYDVTAEDVFGNKFGDEVSYDSGIEDCHSDGFECE